MTKKKSEQAAKPKRPRPLPQSTVAPITAKELKRDLGMYLPKAPEWVWQQLTEVLNDLRLHGVAPHVIARRDAILIEQARRLNTGLTKLMQQIAARAETLTPADLAPADSGRLVLAVTIADVARYCDLFQAQQLIEKEVLPLLDPRLAPPGGHRWRAAWEATAHVVWGTARQLFTVLGHPVSQNPGSLFVRFVIDVVNRLVFDVPPEPGERRTDQDDLADSKAPKLTEEALAQWAKRHKDITRRKKPVRV
jgi:hypothetical protein